MYNDERFMNERQIKKYERMVQALERGGHYPYKRVADFIGKFSWWTIELSEGHLLTSSFQERKHPTIFLFTDKERAERFLAAEPDMPYTARSVTIDFQHALDISRRNKWNMLFNITEVGDPSLYLSIREEDDWNLGYGQKIR